MPVRTLAESAGADQIFHFYDLENPNVQLDLSAGLFELGVNEASVVLGRDVIRPGGLRPEPGRRSVGVSVATVDRPIVDAEGIAFAGRTGVLFSGVFDGSRYRLATKDNNQGLVNNAFVKQDSEHEFSGPWPQDAIGSIFVFDGDNRGVEKRTSYLVTGVDALVTGDPDGNALIFGEKLTLGHKFSLLFGSPFDKRGIWVTNGESFWLLQNGQFVKYMDLSYLGNLKGERWDIVRIASNLVMFVNPTWPARTVNLNSSPLPDGDVSDDSTLGGLVPPDIQEFRAIFPNLSKKPSWTVDRSTGTAADVTPALLGGGLYKFLVRAVNYVDAAESTFVTALVETFIEDEGRQYDILALGGTNPGIQVASVGAEPSNDTRPAPMFHRRWSHIEFWRTTSLGVNFFREHVAEIATGKFINDQTPVPAGTIVVSHNTNGFMPHAFKFGNSDTNLLGFRLASSDDLISGGLPPRCRKVASLGGVTVCMGRASDDPQDITMYSRNFHALSVNYGAGLGINVNGLYKSYTFREGDQLEAVYMRSPTQKYVSSVAAIDRRASQDGIVLRERFPGIPVVPTQLDVFIRRPYALTYPSVASDEDVWYSRTNAFSPESFPTRVKIISRVSDVFRDMVPVGRYLAVLMDAGVHLLFLDNPTDSRIELFSDTISAYGDGTPWDHSVISFRNTVFWATPEGPKTMSVSNQPDRNGHRGTISDLDRRGAFRSWFREAFDAGQSIDAGFDSDNQAIRWRRRIDKSHYQVLQHSLKTGRSTLLDDDTGMRYANTSFVSTDDRAEPRLYSVTEEGAAFEVNVQAGTDPYFGSIVQSEINNLFGVSNIILELSGQFSPFMIGDVIRFTSPTNERVDGAVRVIKHATLNGITFDAVIGLSRGDSFTIGSVRFRIRWAPFQGSNRIAAKVLEGITLKAFPGERHDAGGIWEDDNPGTMTLRAYEDFSDKAVDCVEDVEIFENDEEGRRSDDRVQSLRATGAAIEVEIESLNARTDFVIETMRAEVSEARGDVRVDLSGEVTPDNAPDNASTRNVR